MLLSEGRAGGGDGEEMGTTGAAVELEPLPVTSLSSVTRGARTESQPLLYRIIADTHVNTVSRALHAIHRNDTTVFM